jgi:hypothetical protein
VIVIVIVIVIVRRGEVGQISVRVCRLEVENADVYRMIALLCE